MNINRRGFLFGSAAAATLAGCATGKVGLRDLKPGEKLRAAGYHLESLAIIESADPEKGIVFRGE